MPSFIILHPVINTPVQVIDIIRILAHALACHVGNLCHIHAVTLGGLHNYVECFLISVVTDKGSYTECNLCLILEIIIQCSRTLEIQAVAEQKCLCPWIDSQTVVVGYHLVSPLVRISAIMTHSRKSVA